MLKHYQPAHTDSDISVHFVEADRLARSVRHFLEVLDTLNHLGIEFVSFRENLDTGGPLGRAVIVIVSPVAELERNLIVERVTQMLAQNTKPDMATLLSCFSCSFWRGDLGTSGSVC